MNNVKTNKKDQKYVNILGIKVLSTDYDRLLTAISKNISSSKQFSIFTPNPELVLASTKNSSLRDALNSATYCVPDGIGLRFASKFLYNKSLNIIPGRKLFEELVKMAEECGWKIFLYGGWNNEAVLAAEHLISLYPNIIIFTSRGPKLNKEGDPDTKEDIKVQSDVVKRINEIKPDLLFVAFGNPKQELWIYNNLSKLKVDGAMAVGGTFRYLAGIVPLPPKFMENLGLEWLWRLITEPKRFLRIWNAIIAFPLKVFWYKISGN